MSVDVLEILNGLIERTNKENFYCIHFVFDCLFIHEESGKYLVGLL